MYRTEITFVRHAEGTHMQTPDIVAGHAGDAKLTEFGEVQAMALGLSWYADGYRPTNAYTSNLKRARKTYEIAARAADQTLGARSYGDLDEQCLGEHEGQPRDTVYTDEVRYEIARQGASYTHPGSNQNGNYGESIAKAGKRVIAFMRDKRRGASRLHEDDITIAVGHQGSLRAMMARIALDGFLDRSVDPHELQAAFLEQPLLPPCSQTRVILEGGPRSESIVHRFEGIAVPLDPRYVEMVQAMV